MTWSWLPCYTGIANDQDAKNPRFKCPEMPVPGRHKSQGFRCPSARPDVRSASGRHVLISLSLLPCTLTSLLVPWETARRDPAKMASSSPKAGLAHCQACLGGARFCRPSGSWGQQSGPGGPLSAGFSPLLRCPLWATLRGFPISHPRGLSLLHRHCSLSSQASPPHTMAGSYSKSQTIPISISGGAKGQKTAGCSHASNSSRGQLQRAEQGECALSA